MNLLIIAACQNNYKCIVETRRLKYHNSHKKTEKILVKRRIFFTKIKTRNALERGPQILQSDEQKARP